MIEPIIYRKQTAAELFGERAYAECVEEKVKKIIDDVKTSGDLALRLYAKQFDGFSGNLKVESFEIEEAFTAVSESFKNTLSRSVKNVAEFHARQKKEGFEIRKNDRITGQKVTPVKVAGIYVPGGTAAYPSSVIMNAVPAKIAGVEKLVMTTPVKADGKVRAEVLVAAAVCGVDEIYKVGGAQAIAALAYGTDTIPRADVITGPGNAYVAAAKKLVSSVCKIDMIAGPSEILIIADKTAKPAYVAADMLSQAEHDTLASAILITCDVALAKAVSAELLTRVESVERRQIAKASLNNNCKIIVTPDIKTAVKLSEEFAPEHLELCVEDPFGVLESITNAGSVFLGNDTPEAVGDYFSGANHTLPTGGTARFSSPLSVDDFLKTTQYVYYTKRALESDARDIMDFAKAEGLGAHAESVAVRLKI